MENEMDTTIWILSSRGTSNEASCLHAVFVFPRVLKHRLEGVAE